MNRSSMALVTVNSTLYNLKRRTVAKERDPAYLDTSLPLDERVHDLLSRLSLEEKVSQMVHECKAIPRLGIPAYNYWSECLHGVAGNGRATVFPQAIGLAATWDTRLLQRVGTAIGDEGRAK